MKDDQKLERVDILSMLRKEIEELESPSLRSQISKGLIAPIRERRTFATDGGEAQGELWIFYKVPGHDVALAYSQQGYDTLPKVQWGLVGVNDDSYGSSGGWYLSLKGLLVDSGYFDVE